ncbi:pentapeptide repeat-containing protein [Janthinobacterium sp. GB1R12]|uniref:anti-phage Hailong system effector protein HalA n=1 Tax=Janthinobacterium sp. GB1R12 TaxID=3424190 RepID=UPI003F21F46C
MTNKKKSIKRDTSYWDVLYSPNSANDYEDSNWIFDGISGVEKRCYTAEKLQEESRKYPRFTLRGKNFQFCDFRGDFFEKNLGFSKCNFEKCDFGYANWKKVKFTDCKFKQCSFTMCAFEDCQFIDCKWEEISISGTETRFNNTLITNPDKFINSAYTNIKDAELLKQKNTNTSYQKMRLEESKGKIARALVANLEKVGSDKFYYDAVKCHSIQRIREKISKTNHEIFSRKNILINILLKFFYHTEKIIMELSGLINDWGNSLTRPIIFGISLICLFSIIYSFLGISSDWKLGLMMAFDITFLIGYTKHATTTSSYFNQTIFALNALLGLWWYAIIVPTVVNRISRVRL